MVGDALRQNDVMLADALVLRLPLLGFAWRPSDFFDQITEALRAGMPAPRPER